MTHMVFCLNILNKNLGNRHIVTKCSYCMSYVILCHAEERSSVLDLWKTRQRHLGNGLLLLDAFNKESGIALF